VSYQGTGQRYEFNRLIIVSRTVAGAKHWNSGSKKLPGKIQSRIFPAVLQQTHASSYERLGDELGCSIYEPQTKTVVRSCLIPPKVV